jgi:DNA-binding NarL/FixJ family response regulator
MRAILADSHPEVRSALHFLLEENEITVIGEVDTSYDLLWQLNGLRPDLVLLDWELPGTNVCDLAKILKARYPELGILGMGSQSGWREQSLKAGAFDYVCKSEPPERLVRALELMKV